MTAKASGRQERLANAAEMIFQVGAIRVPDLAVALGVSPMTAYRDVEALEELGVLRRDHGQVVATATSTTETSHRFRSMLNLADKQRLCRVAAGMLRPGVTVMLDDSSTVGPLVPLLAAVAPATVITTSHAVASAVVPFPKVSLVVAGGRLRRGLDSYFGDSTVAMLRDHAADVCVMSATAVIGGSHYHPFEENVAIKRAMLASSARRVLLLDPSKFRQRAACRVGCLSDFDDVVISGEIPPSAIEAIESAGPTIHWAT